MRNIKSKGKFLLYLIILEKMFANIDAIPELKKSTVKIRNTEELLKKINKIIQDGNEKLQIVTDFDHTITRLRMDNGDIVLTSFGMLRDCPSIPKHYKEEDQSLCDKYKPIEVDPRLTSEDKTKHMVDWYIAANNLLKDLKFPRTELLDVAQSMMNCFRIGVHDLIAWSQNQQVPVLVFSAGLGDAVVASLRAANFLLPHVKVVSNFLAVDETDTIVGIKGDIIHTLNKNTTALKNSEYYQMVKDRSNVVLMGDNIGDAGMAEGMDHCDVIIKVGFLGHNIEENLHNYLNHFDIVLIDDETFDVINALLKFVP